MQNNRLTSPGVSRHCNAHCRVCQGRENGLAVSLVNPRDEKKPFSITVFSHSYYMESSVFWLDVFYDPTVGTSRIIMISDLRLFGITRNASFYEVKCMLRGAASPADEIIEGSDSALRLTHRDTMDFWQCPWPVAHIIKRELS